MYLTDLDLVHGCLLCLHADTKSCYEPPTGLLATRCNFASLTRAATNLVYVLMYDRYPCIFVVPICVLPVRTTWVMRTQSCTKIALSTMADQRILVPKYVGGLVRDPKTTAALNFVVQTVVKFFVYILEVYCLLIKFDEKIFNFEKLGTYDELVFETNKV